MHAGVSPSHIAHGQGPGLSVPGLAGDHTVQFYEADDALVATVVRFLADGLAGGQQVIVVATAPHREAIAARLDELDEWNARTTDIGRRLLMLDARATLDLIMVDGMPDGPRFATVVGDVIERFMTAPAGQTDRQARPARVFGELVDLLWMDGNPDGAIRLEQLWNELADRLDFALLCGYSMDRFADVSHAERFRDVCREHRHVLPTERYTRGSEAERLIEISMLQQRARALETELARRAELDARLRSALAEHDHLLREERAARAEAERARAAAQEASRSKSAFLAMMSHELRTPLNAIGGYSELIAMGVYGPVATPQRDAIARVQRSQQHLLGLIDQLLDYAQVDSGALCYAFTDVSMHDLMSAIDALMMPHMQERRLTYLSAVPATTIVARADQQKLTQILRNLLTNAAQFTQPGGMVSVECEAAGEMVLVRVSDTGVGIPAAQLGVIFDPFTQGESPLTRVRGGVGLGLAISRDLARGMGGDIRVESEPGAGTTFTLTVPRAAAPAGDDAATPAPGDGRRAAAANAPSPSSSRAGAGGRATGTQAAG